MNIARLPSTSSTDSDEYTIDQLAQASSVTVRNIRAHQSRGLMPPPEVRGRTGFYTQEHLARLQLILEMQADGFNLNSIKRILEGMPRGSAGQVLGFERALRTPWGDEEPEVFDAPELMDVIGGGNEAMAKKASRLGIIIPLGDGRFEVPSPTLLRAGMELNRLGVPISERLDILEQLNRHVEGVSEAFVKLFLEHVWKPFHEGGEREQDWPQVYEALERLRPIANEALVSAFHLAMAKAVDHGLEKVRHQQARDGRRKIEDRQPERV
ncbi:MAG: MerR family transcriptional regulator, partial [Candidatus Dormibacteraeota bacterium]|nr:MerR family transcriptional regulator [Candidatus Dormibacteraeota bacterium]